MKKNLLALLMVLAIAVPAFAATKTKQNSTTQTNQEEESKIKFYGMLDVYGFQTDGTWGYSGYAEGESETFMRALLGANIGLAENIEGNFALLYGRYWGNTQTDGTTANDFLDILRIAEANIVFNNMLDNDKLSLKIGRYFWGEEGDTMFYFGLKDGSSYFPLWYGYYGGESGIDGILLTYDDKEKLKINAGYAKLDTEQNEIDESKESLFFADVNYKFNDTFSLKGYYYDYERYTDNPAPVKHKEENIGLKPKAILLNNKLNMSLEFVQQFWDYGETSKRFQNYSECWFAKLDVKYDILDNLDVRGMYIRSGKNFSAQHGDIYFGLIDTVYYYNYIDFDALNIGLDYTLNKFEFIADYFRFCPYYSYRYNPVYEIDAQIKYNYTKDISFKLAAGWRAYEAAGDEADVVYVFGATWKFDARK